MNHWWKTLSLWLGVLMISISNPSTGVTFYKCDIYHFLARSVQLESWRSHKDDLSSWGFEQRFIAKNSCLWEGSARDSDCTPAPQSGFSGFEAIAPRIHIVKCAYWQNIEQCRFFHHDLIFQSRRSEFWGFELVGNGWFRNGRFQSTDLFTFH